MIGIVAGLSLSAMLMGTVAASASPAATGGTHIKAVVVQKACVASGGMMVTLSAITTNTPRNTAATTPVRYAWDLTTDGIFETPLSLSPMTTQFYVHTATGHVTATVKTVGGISTHSVTSSVTFSTLCP